MKKLVAYFSASGVTAGKAQQLAKLAGADIYAIEPAVKYTEADLNWMDKKSRSTIEMNDKAFRPELAEKNKDLSAYDMARHHSWEWIQTCFPLKFTEGCQWTLNSVSQQKVNPRLRLYA